MITRSPRHLVAAACAGAVAIGLVAVPTTAFAGESFGKCTSTSFTSYGYRTSCLRGSTHDRVHFGDLDATFAIRGDRVVVYASPNHGWVPISNGKADYVTFVDASSNGFELICVKTKAGRAYSSSHDRHRGWGNFSAGCPMG